MIKFSNNFKYDKYMDKEIIPLCNALNSLPGIKTNGSCCGHDKNPITIFFNAYDTEGLFFLVRCIDKRYWKHGGDWGIELSVGDQYKDNYRPICYMLHSGNFKGEEALKQMDSLIENMVYHLNHKNFMKGFDLNINNFKTE